MSSSATENKPFWKRPLGITIIALAAILTIGIINAITGGTDNATTAGETETTATVDEPTVTEAEPEDITEQVKAAAADHSGFITKATRDSGGFVLVETTIVDPRGDDLSPEAVDALAICNDLAEDPANKSGRIQEADGTTFVTLKDGICAEH